MSVSIHVKRVDAGASDAERDEVMQYVGPVPARGDLFYWDRLYYRIVEVCHQPNIINGLPSSHTYVVVHIVPWEQK